MTISALNITRYTELSKEQHLTGKRSYIARCDQACKINRKFHLVR